MNDPRNPQNSPSQIPVSFREEETDRPGGTNIMGALPSGRPSSGPSAAGVPHSSSPRPPHPSTPEPTWSERTWSDGDVHRMTEEWKAFHERERARHAVEIGGLRLEVAKLVTLTRLREESMEEACRWLHHLYGNDVATLQAIETLRVRATKVFELRGGSHPALTLLAMIDRLSPAELDEMARNILPKSLKEALLQLRSRSSL